MTFTWKKGFGELEEKVKSQNKSANRKMNKKDLILFSNSPKKIIMILNWKLQEQTFLGVFFKKKFFKLLE